MFALSTPKENTSLGECLELELGAKISEQEYDLRTRVICAPRAYFLLHV